MDTVELTDSQKQRLESIQAELREATGAYATVTTTDVMEYVLDLAEAVDDPDPQTADGPTSWTADEPQGRQFPREALRDRLTERNRKHSDGDAEQAMDLYSIAASYDVTGRGSMTKEELVEAILDTAERRYHDPFDQVDVEFPSAESADPEGSDDVSPTDSGGEEERATHTEETDGERDGDGGPDTEAKDDESETEDDGGPDTEEDSQEAEGLEAGDSDQLDAMLSLLETHDGKWWATDGDARYEVELPDGRIQTARTKDDVRALLFKNY